MSRISHRLATMHDHNRRRADRRTDYRQTDRQTDTPLPIQTPPRSLATSRQQDETRKNSLAWPMLLFSKTSGLAQLYSILYSVAAPLHGLAVAGHAYKIHCRFSLYSRRMPISHRLAAMHDYNRRQTETDTTTPTIPTPPP